MAGAWCLAQHACDSLTHAPKSYFLNQVSGGVSNNLPSNTQNLGVPPPTQTAANPPTTQEEYKPPETFKTNNEANPYNSNSTNANDYYTPSDTFKAAPPPLKSYAPEETREKPPPEESVRRNDQVNRSYQDQRPTPTQITTTPSYQPQTTSATFSPTPYQQSYMAPKQQYNPVKREPSSPSINTSRNDGVMPSTNVLQNPTSTQQRPFQNNPNPPRPPVSTQPPKTMPPIQKPPTYTSPTPSYATNPPQSRPTLSNVPSYTSSRPITQRPISSTPSSQFINSPSYSSTPSRSPGLSLPQDTSRWSGDPTRTSQPSRPIVPSSNTMNLSSSDDKKNLQKDDSGDKMAMQAKFKNMIRQKMQFPTDSNDTPTGNPIMPPLPSVNRDVMKKPPMTMEGSGRPTEVLVNDEPDDFDEPFSDDENDDEDDDISLNSPQNESNTMPVKSEIFQPASEDDTSVMKNIKFFEKNDKAKVPLTPKPITPKPKTSTTRPSSIDIVSSTLDVKYHAESGVDESPVKHPNLRSITDTPMKVAKMKKPSPRPKSGRSSYPGTPKRVPSAPIYSSAGASMPQTPKRIPKTPRQVSNHMYSQNFQSDRSHGENGRKQNNGWSGNDEPKRSARGVSASPARSPATPKSPGPLKSPATPKSLPRTPDAGAPPIPLIKKIPMNKIQVGAAPSPNLKTVKSKIGSLANTAHKPGGGNIRIQSQKLDFSSAQARIANKNDHYLPGGGEKKIPQVKLQWNAKPKVGSLDNTTYQPGGGEKKIESQKLDFKEKARSRVGSKDNVKYVPGGGDVKIENKKLEFAAQSKIGSLDNVKHRPGGGNIQIFDDKTFMKHSAKQQSNCDLAVVTEVRGVTESAEDEATDISIKKTTTIASTQPAVVKTTQVTVVSRSPSKERRDVGSAGSTHQVKLTYSTTMVPSEGVSEPVPKRQPEIIHTSQSNEPPIAKLLQNEQAAHEKVGEIWKESQNATA